jgi:AraC-like DNA-binding protein
MKVLFFSIYALAPIVLILKYRKSMMEFYSTIDDAKILKLFAVAVQYVFSAIFLIYIFFGYLNGPAFLRPDIPVYFVFILGIPIFLMVFFGLTDENFFKCTVSTADLLGKDVEPVEEEKDGSEEEKYQKNKIPDELVQRGMELLKDVMETDKPFTDSNLTLINLAQMIHMKPHHLSQILNGIIGENFYVYINSARIKYAVDLMKDNDNKDKSILEIAYQSGFNSKSAFNTYFKNIMGQTPSKFRKKHT